MIGTFADMVFRVNADIAYTFDELQRTTAARWAIHEPIMGYPLPQYLGPGQDSLSFTMYFDMSLGVNPREQMDLLAIYARTGFLSDLTIGGKGVGVGQWYIESVTQRWEKVDNQGIVIAGRVDVTLKEYP